MALQFDALSKAGCAQVFRDTASGAKADRPGLTAAPSYARKGDVLVVWKLDRLGRSLPHLIETVTNLEKRGNGFRSLTEALDTTTSSGRLIFHTFGALGQFEQDLIRERTRAGLNAAISRGRRGGRKPVMTAEKPSSSPRLDRARVHRPRSRGAHQSWKDRSLCRPQRQSGRNSTGKIVCSPIVHANRTTRALSCLHPL